MSTHTSAKKRSLILAGGGLKVAFQAGVLQVWLDEAGLTFEHADGASGGIFNLAMYCQGMSGTQIADNWRNLPPTLFADFNWEAYAKLFYAASLLKLDLFREQVFPRWGLDWQALRASPREATFNMYNFSKYQLEVLTPDKMTEDYLIAGVSLPMWFPPVVINGDTYIDPVYVTDANIEEAIRRGADELWVIWTVSQKGEWRPGFVAHYFQIIEASANGHFRLLQGRIAANNVACAAGQVGEFGRPVELKLLQAEVPLHYLLNLSAERMQEVVNLGVQVARQWCVAQGLLLAPPQEQEMLDQTTLCFTEEMKGYMAFGVADYVTGLQEGTERDTFLQFHLIIKLDGVEHFVTHPSHMALAAGFVECEALGGKLPVEQGWFQLFVDEGDPQVKKMLYRLFFRDQAGHPLTLSGFKLQHDHPHFDIWHDTSTLFLRILQGHVAAGGDEQAEVVAAGIIRIHYFDFLHQLTTFRVEGPSTAEKVAALTHFGSFFLGKLWDVYGQQVLSYGPF